MEGGISAIMLVILFAATLLLEFLYELGGGITTYKPTSYIFVIDDSSSMVSNDPYNERVSAIKEIMERERIPYAVYKFSDDARLIRPMDSYHGDEDLGFNSYDVMCMMGDAEDNFPGGLSGSGADGL